MTDTAGASAADAGPTQPYDAAVKTTSKTAEADLVEALGLATKAHGIGYRQHLRTEGWSMAFEEEIVGFSSEAALDKGRLML